MRKSVLCVDDNEDNCEILKHLFEAAGYIYYSCNKPAECLSYVDIMKFSAIILDNILHEKNGEQIFLTIKNICPDSALFFFTADAQSSSREKAMSLGASDYLVKPNDLDRIVSRVSGFID